MPVLPLPLPTCIPSFTMLLHNIISLLSVLSSLSSPTSSHPSTTPSRQSSIPTFISTESPYALSSILANTGPDGSKCEGAASGIVLASPSTSNPDYDYTWIRDASLVNKLLIDAYTQGRAPVLQGTINAWVTSMQAIQQVSNPSGTVSSGGLGEPKFMPDGTAFTGAWGRPQRDGPALRSIALMTYANWLLATGDSSYVTDTIWPMVQLDLDYVAANWNATGFDLWEELDGSSFFTTSSQSRALTMGAAFAAALPTPDTTRSATYSTQAANTLCFLQSFWSPSQSYAIANINLNSGRSGLDANTLLASIHAFDPAAGCAAATFQPCSDKALANHYAVVNSFRGSLYAINEGKAANAAVAIGRYPEDVYYNGNPWYLATLAAAEQLYDALYVWSSQGSLTVTSLSQPFFSQFLSGVATGSYSAGSSEYDTVTQGVGAYADGFVGIVQEYIGSGGGLSEQFSKTDGTPTSAADLTWSYAAFLTMADARNGSMPVSWGASAVSLPSGACSLGPQPAMVAMTFVEDATTTYGQNVYITGSIGALSDWSTTSAVALSSANYPNWQVTINIPAGTTFQYKFIKIENGDVTWEDDPNRQYTAPSSGAVTVTSSWQ